MRQIAFYRNCFLKKSFIFLVLFLGTHFLFSVQYWGEGLFVDFGFSAKTTLPSNTPLEATLGFRKHVDKAAFEAFLCVDEFSFDGALSFQGIPLQVKFFSLGLQYLTHVSRSFVSDENPDLVTWMNCFLLTTSFDLGKDKANPLNLKVGLGVYAGESHLQLTDNKLILRDASVAFEFELIKRFFYRNEIMFRLATFDTLHFREFANLWWQLGYSYDLTKQFSLGGVVEVVYTDQIFLSGAISGIQAKLCAVYRL